MVRERLKQALDAGERVQFSFAGVEDLTSAFMNAAVGQLLEAYPEERVRGGIAPIEANVAIYEDYHRDLYAPAFGALKDGFAAAAGVVRHHG